VRATIRHAPKAGNSEAEYEDACRLAPASGASGRLRVAVADGASESMLAGRWAGALTEAFASADDPAYDQPARFAATVGDAADAWPDLVAADVADREGRGSPLRWYERPGLAAGAFATLLAVAVDDGDDPGWRAAAIGDTCLFHVRDGALLSAFPVESAAEFGTAPPLLGTLGADPALIADRVRMRAGRLGPGDVLYACTDALAAWVLARAEDGAPPWGVLDALDDDAFAEWLGTERAAERMGNDDVTLVRVAR
jgi:hypothetical protein